MDSSISLTVILLVAVLLIIWLVMIVRGVSAPKSDKKNSRIVHSERMLDYARRAAQREDYELALDLCEQIFEQPQAYETFPAALRLRIDVLRQLHRYDEAETDIERLRRLDAYSADEIADDLPDDAAETAESRGQKHHM